MTSDYRKDFSTFFYIWIVGDSYAKSITLYYGNKISLYVVWEATRKEGITCQFTMKEKSFQWPENWQCVQKLDLFWWISLN